MNLIWNLLNYFVFLYPLYMSFVWTTGGLLFYFRRERKRYPLLDSYPFFSIVIPAHDEEAVIEDTIKAVSDLEYPKYEVIVVNDGSEDKTPEILDELAKRYPYILKIIHLSPNSGKAKALNIGILFSKGELVLAMDADCILSKDALRVMAWHFMNYPRVGAVTGNPRILNRTTLLGKIQVGEYSSIIGLIKRTQRVVGKLLTVSGVFAAFRKSALADSGFFDSDTVTEDIDITWKLERRFWDVRFEPRSISWILAPESVMGVWRQRVRWAQGGIEVLKKHFNIWGDWKQRRLWPIYIEYATTIFWAFSFSFLILSWLFSYSLYYFSIISQNPIQPFIPPAWTGSILALTCLLQFMTSLYIDYHYENKSLLKYYFWVIWYPLFYWILSAMAVFAGMFNVFIKRGGVSERWKSPDRGIHIQK